MTDRRERRETGRIKVHPDGFGFMAPEGDTRAEEIFVAPRARAGAMDGDRVSVEWWVGARGLEGRVLDVVERGRTKVTGVLTGGARGPRFAADDPRVPTPVTLDGGAGGAREGQAVIASILRYPENPDDGITVKVLKVLGDPFDQRTEVEKVLAQAYVEQEFPPEVARFADRMPKTVEAGDRVDRADLRAVPFTTIDPETARDFDDAVAWQRLPDGTERLWVAVADVSHYVRDRSLVDVEAHRRGCSIYLPDRAIPMLPEPLSSNICSLVPHEDRLAMVARIDFNRATDIIATDFMAAVIHSQARFDYPGVAAALDGDTRGKRAAYAPFLESLQAMDGLARRLRAKRFARGALDLNLPETKVVLDQDDPRRIRDIVRARRDPGERGAYAMIEEFMLAANEAVARSFTERGEDAIFRVHDAPSEERLETFAALAGRYGVNVDIDEARTPAGLQRVLASLKGHAAEKPLSFQLLRSLKQATYEVDNVGHFGLAATDYVHFTSPIRRYPDLEVHRLLKRRLASLGKPAGGFPALSSPPPPATRNELAQSAKESSFRERKAMEIEREVVDAYRAFFMRDRVGDELGGTVTGVTSFGVFVSTDEPFVEGLIRLTDLPGGDWRYDEEALRITQGRSGRSVALGDTARVVVLNVNVATRRIEFRLAEGSSVGTERSPRAGAGPGRGRGRKEHHQRLRERSAREHDARIHRGDEPRGHGKGGAPTAPARDKHESGAQGSPAREKHEGGAQARDKHGRTVPAARKHDKRAHAEPQGHAKTDRPARPAGGGGDAKGKRTDDRNQRRSHADDERPLSLVPKPGGGGRLQLKTRFARAGKNKKRGKPGKRR